MSRGPGRWERLLLHELYHDPRIAPSGRRYISGVRLHAQRVVIECKDTATLRLPEWTAEARAEAGNDDALVGVVVHKRRGVADPLQAVGHDDRRRLRGGADRDGGNRSNPIVGRRSTARDAVLAAAGELWRSPGHFPTPGNGGAGWSVPRMADRPAQPRLN